VHQRVKSARKVEQGWEVLLDQGRITPDHLVDRHVARTPDMLGHTAEVVRRRRSVDHPSNDQPPHGIPHPIPVLQVLVRELHKPDWPSVEQNLVPVGARAGAVEKPAHVVAVVLSRGRQCAKVGDAEPREEGGMGARPDEWRVRRRREAVVLVLPAFVLAHALSDPRQQRRAFVLTQRGEQSDDSRLVRVVDEADELLLACCHAGSWA